jgi:hypothetical protein
VKIDACGLIYSHDRHPRGAQGESGGDRAIARHDPTCGGSDDLVEQ